MFHLCPQYLWVKVRYPAAPLEYKRENRTVLWCDQTHKQLISETLAPFKFELGTFILFSIYVNLLTTVAISFSIKFSGIFISQFFFCSVDK